MVHHAHTLTLSIPFQNIRNNKNHRRTPKWAIRYGLVDDSEIRRKQKRSQWATRYNERLPQSALEGQDYAEDQVPDRHRADSASNAEPTERPLWNRDEDESFYGRRRDGDRESSNGSGGRWHYPANFDDAEPPTPTASSSRKKEKKKKDRWALSEDARMGVLPDGEDGKVKKRKKKSGSVKRSKKRPEMESNPSLDSRSDVVEPEDPVGGLYGERRTRANGDANGTTADPQSQREREDRDLFEHQF